MRVVVAIITFLLFTGISCRNLKQPDSVSSQTPCEVYKEPDTEIKGKSEISENSNLSALLDLPVSNDVLFTFLYGLILLFSCLYCRQAGKQRTTLEENLLMLSRRFNWRHRLALYLLSWLQRDRHSSRRNKRSRKR